MLSRKNRLSPSQIDTVKKTNHRKSSKYFTMLFSKDNKDSTDPKFAIIVSNKVSKKAVTRNRIKRIVREALKKNLSNIHSNAIVIAKMGTESVDNKELFADLEKLLVNI